MKYGLRLFCVLAFSFVVSVSFSQSIQEKKNKEEIRTFQQSWQSTYADPSRSPLPKRKRAGFEGLKFYPIDLKYRVEAKFVKSQKSKRMKMRTSDGRIREFRHIGDLFFQLDGKSLRLEAYRPTTDRSGKKSLFIPFLDRSCGGDSYGGGRYLDLHEPAEGSALILDFNKAYNPYCAYSAKYSCPVPPKANRLPVEILAGMMAPSDH